MPGVTLHLDLAERTAACASAHELRFDRADPTALNAFRQGAFGPDLGYFPGCWRPLSDLAHCVSAGDLARALVRTARSPIEHAFAAGWATHVLADHAIHPLIGCAVGELLHGRSSTFVDGDSHPAAHVRVEAGLDSLWATRAPGTRRLPLAPVFDERTIGFLAEAYDSTYDVTFPREVLLRCHRLAAVRSRQGLTLAAWTGRLMGTGSEPAHLRLASVVSGIRARLRRLLGHHSTPLAILLPVEPPTWLAAAAEDAVHGLPELILEELRTGLAGVETWNLDTGRLEWVDPEHGGRRRGLAAIAEWRADHTLDLADAA
jgi:hypothetical protein